MKIYIVYSIIWIAVTTTVIAGLYFTKHARCLLAFIIPALLSCSDEDE